MPAVAAKVIYVLDFLFSGILTPASFKQLSNTFLVSLNDFILSIPKSQNFNSNLKIL